MINWINIRVSCSGKDRMTKKVSVVYSMGLIVNLGIVFRLVSLVSLSSL